MGRSGRLVTLLELHPLELHRRRRIYHPQKTRISHHDALDHLRAHDHSRILPDVSRLRRAPLQDTRHRPRRHPHGRWPRPGSAAPILDHGHPSALPLSRLRRLRRPLRLRHGFVNYQAAGRRLDPHHPPLGASNLGLPIHRHLTRRRLGLRRPRLGRLLGLGPRRKCLPPSLDHLHLLPALRHDAREKRHDEGLEHGPRLSHFFPVYLRYLSYSLRHCKFRPRLRAIVTG